MALALIDCLSKGLLLGLHRVEERIYGSRQQFDLFVLAFCKYIQIVDCFFLQLLFLCYSYNFHRIYKLYLQLVVHWLYLEMPRHHQTPNHYAALHTAL